MRKLVIVLGVLCAGLLLGYGAVSLAYPAFPPGVYNRQERYGFFLNRYDPGGDRVWKGVAAWGDDAIPPWVDTADEFISYVLAKLNGPSQSNQDRVGASFIIQTMIGNEGNAGNHPPSAAEIAEWDARVRYAESMGRIIWRTNYTYLLNSYYQGCCAGSNWNDDGFYDDPAGWRTDPAILFGDGSGGGFGNVAYAIKWHCANPVGQLGAIPDDLNFNMSGLSNVDDNTVLPGQNITFSHSLTNGGPTATGTTPINWITQSSTSPGGPWSNVSSGNAGTFNAGQNKPNIGNQLVPVPAGAIPNSQICRRIVWNPDTQGGGSEASAPACATVQYDFNLTPLINISITGIDGPVTGNIAQPGDSVTFNYSVRNTGLTQSQSVTCTYRQATYTGYSTAAPVNVFVPAGASCPPASVFPGTPAPATPTASETIASVAANTSICRTLTLSPATQSGGSITTVPPVCVHVASMPYARAYGGDIMAGGGLAAAGGSCSLNNGAAIIGWNRRSAAGWAGAATQFSALAMSLIYDSASSLGNGAGAASPPAGLGLRNTSTNINAGNFGGQFGSAPCVPDYYSRRPSSTLTIPATITAMTTGTYGLTGNAYFSGGGSIDMGERTTVYVGGDAYINTNVIFNGSGSWNSTNIPSFQLIVRGNIYIDLAVTQLDGLYVAQPRVDGTKGIIYTCASTVPTIPTLPSLSGNLATQCDNKLTVNGAFAARQIQLLRTIGTLRDSAAGEPSTDPSISEVFNFNPAFWISQPISNSGAGEYDSITSLPPVL